MENVIRPDFINLEFDSYMVEELKNKVNFINKPNGKCYELSPEDVFCPELLLLKLTETTANGNKKESCAILKAFLNITSFVDKRLGYTNMHYMETLQLIITNFEKYHTAKFTKKEVSLVEDALYDTQYGYLPTLMLFKTCKLTKDDIEVHTKDSHGVFLCNITMLLEDLPAMDLDVKTNLLETYNKHYEIIDDYKHYLEEMIVSDNKMVNNKDILINDIIKNRYEQQALILQDILDRNDSITLTEKQKMT